MKLQDLRNYLISSCSYFQAESRVESPQKSALWAEWVVARSLCVCRPVEANGIAAGELDAMLRLQVQEWAPFDEPEYFYQDLGNRALVWAWDGALRRRHCSEVGVNPDVVRPETVVAPLLAPPRDDALVLVSAREGFEARAYRRGRLVHTRWWPELPDLRSWNQTRLLFDLEPDVELPKPDPVVSQREQAANIRTMVLPFLRAESTLFVLFFALFLVASAYQLSGIFYAGLAADRAEVRIDELNSAITPVLIARDEALAALDQIESVATLYGGPLQLEYLGDLLARLAEAREAGTEVELVAWDYRVGEVAISVVAETVSAADLLSLFETVPWLLEPRVGEDPARGRTRITGLLAQDWDFAPPALAEAATP